MKLNFPFKPPWKPKEIKSGLIKWKQLAWAKLKTGKGVAILIGLVLLVPAYPVLASWSDHHVLPALSSMNIFALTRDLNGMTDQMITETAHLEQEVNNAGTSLGTLDRQVEALSSQIQTHDGIKNQLGKQLAGNIKARELMHQILSREKTTLDLTGKAAERGNNITAQMEESLGHLAQVSQQTGTIATRTKTMNGQMDELLAELDQSIRNFHFVGKLTSSLDSLKQLLRRTTGIDLPIPRGSGSNSSHSNQPDSNSSGSGSNGLLQPILPAPVPIPLPGSSGGTGSSNNGGLLNNLLP